MGSGDNGTAGSASMLEAALDRYLRMLTDQDLAALFEVIGVPAEPGSIRRLPVPMPAGLVAGTGPGRLTHVAFVLRPEPGTPLRMLECRTRILQLYPDHTLTQHVVVLGEGTLNLDARLN